MNRALRLIACVLALSLPQAVFAQATAPTPASPSAPATPVAPAPAPAAPKPAAATVQTGRTTPAAPAAPATPTAPTANTPAVASADNIKSADALIVEGLDVQPGGLTVEDTVRRAMAVSSTAGEKQADIDAANARIDQTFWQFFPKIGLKASYMRLSPVDAGGLGDGALVVTGAQGPIGAGADGTPENVNGGPLQAVAFEFPVLLNQYTLSANIAIPLMDYLLRLSDASKGAETSKEAAQLALSAAESKVRTDARVLYYNWLRIHAQKSLALKAVERTRARLEDARAAESVGTLSRADLMRIEALVAQAELAVAQAEAARVLLGAQLAIIMRDTGGGEYQIGSALPEVQPSAPIGNAEGQKLITEAVQNRMELKAVDRSLEALGYGADAIDAGSYPRLDAVGELTYANPNQRYFPVEDEFNASWAVGVVASWSFDAPFFAGAQADEVRAQAEGLRAQRRGLEAAVVNDVVSAQLDVVKASAALQAGEVSVRASEEAYRVATDLFRVGRGTTSDMIDAETDLINAKAAMVNARIDLTIASLRLDYALGREAQGKDAVHYK